MRLLSSPLVCLLFTSSEDQVRRRVLSGARSPTPAWARAWTSLRRRCCDCPPRAVKQVLQRLAVDQGQSDKHGRITLVVWFDVIDAGIVGDERVAVLEADSHHERVRLCGLMRSHAC